MLCKCFFAFFTHFRVSPGALDEPLMTSTVRSILAKKTVTVPKYDFVTHCRYNLLHFVISFHAQFRL